MKFYKLKEEVQKIKEENQKLKKIIIDLIYTEDTNELIKKIEVLKKEYE